MDLIIFETVVDEMSITAADQRLGRVQSNISTRIQQLEQYLGAKLFYREHKQLF